MNEDLTTSRFSGAGDEAEARVALRRLAARANTTPNRPLGTYEMTTELTDKAVPDDRFEWRRLAVAAAIAALIGGAVVAINLRPGDSEVASAPVEPVAPSNPEPGAAVQVTRILGAGFTPVLTTRPPSSTIQRQYAEDIDRPETGRWLTITELPGEQFDGESWYDSSDFYGIFRIELVDSATPLEAHSVTCEESGSTTTISAADPQCRMTTMLLTQVDNRAVGVMSSGLSDAEVQSVLLSLMPAPDGFGSVVDPAALPQGLSEIAAGAITAMFEPRSAVDATDRVELSWVPGSPEVNPVLDSAGIDRATIIAIADDGTGLAGQRLLLGEVKDANVGDDAAVVQISQSDAVRVVWRRNGVLLMYEEVGSGADPDATAHRVNALLPRIIGGLAGGVIPGGSKHDEAEFLCFEEPTTATSGAGVAVDPQLTCEIEPSTTFAATTTTLDVGPASTSTIAEQSGRSSSTTTFDAQSVPGSPPVTVPDPAGYVPPPTTAG